MDGDKDTDSIFSKQEQTQLIIQSVILYYISYKRK